MTELNKLAAEMLLWDEGAWILIAFGLTIVGGVIGYLLLSDVQTHLRRVAYLWVVVMTQVIALITFLLVIPYLGAAAEEGVLWVVVFALPASTLAGGILNYWGSAARSNDIQNSPSKAWLGFVPLANLYLVFKSRDQKLVPAKPRRHWARRFVLDPVLIVLSFAVLGTVNAASNVFDSSIGSQVTQSSALTELLFEVRSVEEIMQTEATAMQPTLPIQVDEVTMLSRVFAEGKTLVFEYQLDQTYGAFDTSFSDSLAEQQCRPDVFGPALERGGVIVSRYLNNDGSSAATIVVNGARC